MYEIPNDQVFKTKPLKHQIQGLLEGRDKEFYGILAEMGTGKSKLLIDNSSYLFSNGKINGLIIIGPKSSLRSWSEQQLPTHMPDCVPTRIAVWGPQSKALDAQLLDLLKVEPLKLHILIMNTDAVITDRGYDALELFLRGHNAMLVIDESTSIKNPKSSRTKVLTKLGKQAKYRRIMTGTPVANRPTDIYAQFNFLAEGCLGSSSWFAFRNRYTVTEQKYINGRKFEVITGYQRLEELQRNVAVHSFRVLKKDCLDLPEKIYQKRYIELTPQQLKYYNEMRDNAMTELASGNMVAAPLVITRILRLRQALCNLAPVQGGEVEFISDKNPRLEEVLNLVEEAGDQKILIWSCFVPSILKLVAEINKHFEKPIAAAFYGGVSPVRRQELINEFQDKNSGLQILVLNQATGGDSITLTEASLVIYHDNDWSLKQRQQSEDRAHRIGQTKNVTYVDLIASKTADEIVVDALQDKLTLANIVTGDDLRRVLAA